MAKSWSLIEVQGTQWLGADHLLKHRMSDSQEPIIYYGIGCSVARIQSFIKVQDTQWLGANYLLRYKMLNGQEPITY